MTAFSSGKNHTNISNSKAGSDAGKELLQLAYTLTDKDKECFISDFNSWYDKHKSFINERSEPDKNGKTHYVHKRLRSTWLSLKRNMPYLWVWYDNKELGIPNTNNGIESAFTSMKTHLRLHNGMNTEHKKTFIRAFLKMSLPIQKEDSHHHKCLLVLIS